jgi:hypothetical protein
MNTEKQFILLNYYEGGLMIGQPDEDWPEWIVIKEYEGETQQELDKIEERQSLEMLARMSEQNRMPTENILDLMRAAGKPIINLLS